FGAGERTHGVELWKSDGTSHGTVLFKDIAETGGSHPQYFEVMGGKLFFAAIDSHGFELWRSNGTTKGTRLVDDINPSGDSIPSEPTSLGGALYFRADDGTHGVEL